MKGNKGDTMKGKKIRSAKKLYEHLKADRPIWFESLDSILRGSDGYRFEASDYGQYSFVDVMKSMEHGNLYEVKGETE